MDFLCPFSSRWVFAWPGFLLVFRCFLPLGFVEKEKRRVEECVCFGVSFGKPLA